jgi:hypothetical protein
MRKRLDFSSRDKERGVGEAGDRDQLKEFHKSFQNKNIKPLSP